MGTLSDEQTMKRAVFLDRDGTIIEEVDYLRDLAHLRVLPGAGKAIKRLNDAGFMVVVVTNQSGVARGYFTEEFVHRAHELLREQLALDGARIDAFYHCPHHPKYGEECACRKPFTGMIDAAAKDHNIDVRNSVVVGDKWIDVELGQRAGAASILVKTGYAADGPGNKRPDNVREPDLIAHDLAEAAAWIVEQSKGRRG
jgi:D-glycero-D-manno-heptose 1,7-bisphosphate phosphatase